jgi:hypothetical protein
MILGFAIEVLLFVVLFVLYHAMGRSASYRLKYKIFCVMSRETHQKKTSRPENSRKYLIFTIFAVFVHIHFPFIIYNKNRFFYERILTDVTLLFTANSMQRPASGGVQTDEAGTGWL